MNDLATVKTRVSGYEAEKIVDSICTWFGGLSQNNQTAVVCTTVGAFAGIVMFAIQKGYTFYFLPEGGVIATSAVSEA